MRFLFDECLGRPLMLGLREVLLSDAEFVHLIDKFTSGVKDKVWLPQVAKEGDWIVITGDSGKGSRNGGKLPALCVEYAVTHVMFNTKLQQQKSATKAAALAAVWPQIEALSLCVPGTRAILRYQAIHERVAFRLDVPSVVLRETPTPAAPEPG